MTVELMSKLHQLRRNNRDWLLTLLTAVLTLMIFVFAPLQAAGIFLFQTFAIAGLLVIIGGALIISGNPFAFGLMSIAFIANFVVFFFRLFYPWPYNLHLLAAAWFIIAVTLGIVVARAVFGGGRITYHRVVGAILLYLLIAVTFATLFAFVGLSIPDAFKGIAFEDDSALASALFYLSFRHPDIDRLRGYRSHAPAGAKSLQYRKRHWPTLSGNGFGQACNPRIESRYHIALRAVPTSHRRRPFAAWACLQLVASGPVHLRESAAAGT